MAACAKCGATLAEGASFCGSCGTPVAPAAGGATPAGAVASKTVPSGLTSNMAAMVAYVLTALTGLFMLITEPYRDDRFVRFHAIQATLYYIAAVTVWVLFWGVTQILAALTLGIGALVMLIPAVLLAAAMFLYWAFLLFKAYSNERYEIPYLGKVAGQMAEGPALNLGVAGALAYVLWFISGIVLLVAGPYRTDRNVRFHAFQSILYSVLYVVVAIAWFFAVLIISLFHSYVLGVFMGLIWLAIRLVLFGGWLLLMQRASSGQRFEIPVISQLATKMAG